MHQPAENKDTFLGFLKTPFPLLYPPNFLEYAIASFGTNNVHYLQEENSSSIKRTFNTILSHTLFLAVHNSSIGDLVTHSVTD